MVNVLVAQLFGYAESASHTYSVVSFCRWCNIFRFRHHVISQTRSFNNPRTRNVSNMASESRKYSMSHYLRENQEKIFLNNRQWVASKEAEDSEFFVKLSSGQHPDYL
jgi:hypothetical protein